LESPLKINLINRIPKPHSFSGWSVSSKSTPVFVQKFRGKTTNMPIFPESFKAGKAPHKGA